MSQGGAGLGTQTDVMAQAAEHVARVRTDIDTQLASLRNRLTALPDLWRGAAGAAFIAACNRCDADGRVLAQALGGISDQLRVSGRTYDATEEERLRAVQQTADAANAASSGISTALRGL